MPAIAESPGLSWGVLREKLERAVRRQCPPQLRADVDDLVQEGMVRLVRQGGDVNATYVWRVAWSVVQDARRRRHRKPEHGEEALEREPSASPSPEVHARTAELRQSLAECLELAPESRRDVLTLYLLGHTPLECAGMLGIAPKSAENAVYRGMSSLRACLESKGIS